MFVCVLVRAGGVRLNSAHRAERAVVQANRPLYRCLRHLTRAGRCHWQCPRSEGRHILGTPPRNSRQRQSHHACVASTAEWCVYCHHNVGRCADDSSGTMPPGIPHHLLCLALPLREDPVGCRPGCGDPSRRAWSSSLGAASAGQGSPRTARCGVLTDSGQLCQHNPLR